MNEPDLDDNPPLWDPQEVYLWTLKSFLIFYTRIFGYKVDSPAIAVSQSAIKHVLDIKNSRDKKAKSLEEIEPTELLRMLRIRERECYQTYTPIRNVLDENLKKISEWLDLTDTELKMIKFFLISDQHEFFENPFYYITQLGINEMHSVLADILGLKRSDIQEALRLDGNLRRCGFLAIHEQQYTYTAIEDMADALLLWPMDLRSLYGSQFQLADRATLLLKDFSFLGVKLDTLKRLVENAVRQRTGGVNILLYGAPGTGKTELCRTLTHSIGCDMYEIVPETLEGTPLTGPERFQGYASCQRALRANGQTVVVFDEIEDAVRGNWTQFLRHTAVQKTWINRVLEDNPMPAIWVTSDLSQIDSACLQRFSYSLELTTPPADRKKAMLDAALGGIDAANQIAERASGWEDLTPADIYRTSRAIRLMSSDGGTPPSPEQIIDMLYSRPGGPDPAR